MTRNSANSSSAAISHLSATAEAKKELHALPVPAPPSPSTYSKRPLLQTHAQGPGSTDNQSHTKRRYSLEGKRLQLLTGLVIVFRCEDLHRYLTFWISSFVSHVGCAVEMQSTSRSPSALFAPRRKTAHPPKQNPMVPVLLCQKRSTRAHSMISGVRTSFELRAPKLGRSRLSRSLTSFMSISVSRTSPPKLCEERRRRCQHLSTAELAPYCQLVWWLGWRKKFISQNIDSRTNFLGIVIR